MDSLVDHLVLSPHRCCIHYLTCWHSCWCWCVCCTCWHGAGGIQLVLGVGLFIVLVGAGWWCVCCTHQHGAGGVIKDGHTNSLVTICWAFNLVSRENKEKYQPYSPTLSTCHNSCMMYLATHISSCPQTLYACRAIPLLHSSDVTRDSMSKS